MTTIKTVRAKINHKVSKTLSKKLNNENWYREGVEESKKELAKLKK